MDAGVHLAAHDVDVVALVGEGGGLGGHNLKVGVDAAYVAVVEDLLCRLRGLGGLVLDLGLLLEDAQGGEVVFYLLEGVEGGLAVVGDGLVVSGGGLLGDGLAAAEVEEVLAGGGTGGPDVVGGAEEVGEEGALEASESRDGDGGVVGGAGDADAVVGLGDAALGGGDVGAAFEELGRQAYGNGGRVRFERGGGQVNVAGGWPMRMAMACSNWARTMATSRAWTRAVSSWVLA